MKNQTSRLGIWKKLGTETLLTTPVYTIRRETHAHPDLAREVPFYVVECRECANVFAIDRDDPRDPEARMLVVEQFRAGSGRLSLEIPGGMCDVTDADPRASAARELIEETGASADRWVSLGALEANPAFMRHRMHSFLALNCRIDEKAPIGDGNEVIEARWIRLADFGNLVREGAIYHGMVVSAWGLLQAWLASPDSRTA